MLNYLLSDESPEASEAEETDQDTESSVVASEEPSFADDIRSNSECMLKFCNFCDDENLTKSL